MRGSRQFYFFLRDAVAHRARTDDAVITTHQALSFLASKNKKDSKSKRRPFNKTLLTG
jgi:hypothetical protein